MRHAAICGRVKTIELLLDSGADVNYDNSDCLKYAMINGHYDAIKLLLLYGAVDPVFSENEFREAIDKGYSDLSEFKHVDIINE